MKKLETVKELPKCDTEIGSKLMLLEKWCQWSSPMQGCHNPSTGKKMQYLGSAIKWHMPVYYINAKAVIKK